MLYCETKVYFDGSHYIAIPHTTKPVKRRSIVHDDVITVVEEKEGSVENTTEPSISNEVIAKIIEGDDKVENKAVNIRHLTKKELFEELYTKYFSYRVKQRKKRIIEDMKKYFETDEECTEYVNNNFERKLRNTICRKVRMVRKANLAHFNYFCTFTYDNDLHTEESFKKKLKACLRNLCFRKSWRYMGVWERAPKTHRLHFHGLFNIPENSLSGEILEMHDYSTQQKKMQTTFQSTFFSKRFGRNDFKIIDENERRIGNALAYLMKYIEKTGDKIVYSKNLPQYFISDIKEEDVICKIGQEDRKLLLFDDFTCIDEGCIMGKVCPEVINQMRTCS